MKNKMKYRLQDKLIQVDSPNTNKKYFSSVSTWNYLCMSSGLGCFSNDKIVNTIVNIIDIDHSNVEGETLSIIFRREEINER